MRDVTGAMRILEEVWGSIDEKKGEMLRGSVRVCVYDENVERGELSRSLIKKG